jgi:hypothetical protein
MDRKKLSTIIKNEKKINKFCFYSDCANLMLTYNLEMIDITFREFYHKTYILSILEHNTPEKVLKKRLCLIFKIIYYFKIKDKNNVFLFMLFFVIFLRLW